RPGGGPDRPGGVRGPAAGGAQAAAGGAHPRPERRREAHQAVRPALERRAGAGQAALRLVRGEAPHLRHGRPADRVGVPRAVARARRAVRGRVRDGTRGARWRAVAPTARALDWVYLLATSVASEPAALGATGVALLDPWSKVDEGR